MKIITQKCTLIKKCYRAKRSIDAHKNPLKDCDRKSAAYMTVFKILKRD